MRCTCTAKEKIEHQPGSINNKTRQHPCFSGEAQRRYGRMHLPVAPACNLDCNYCNRRFDCSHESRPGVTSQVISPETACSLYLQIREKHDHIKVAGIAGPGDALANWPAASRTIKLIKQKLPDTIFCLSTNGLMLPQLADELLELGVEYITVTVNTVDPEVGARIYHKINYRGIDYQGVEGARILIENQLRGISYLSSNGAVIKVNTVMIAGINDHQIPEVVREVRDRGAYISNIMPLIPATGSRFAELPPTDTRYLQDMRKKCQIYLQQMFHCRQCRADAVGLLGHDMQAGDEIGPDCARFGEKAV